LRQIVKNIIIVVLLVFAGINASGQFYNGHQMQFGKSRIQYYDFYWSYYRFDNFDCYFNEYGRELAQYASEYAEKRIAEIEDYFDYFLEKRMIFIIYNKQAEFKQSNIGLVSGQEDYNIGGFSQIIKNKVMIYYEGDHKSFERQISAAITEVLVNEMLNEADRRDRTGGNSEITLPEWYLKGLKNYVAFGWDEDTENRVRDGIESGRYKRLGTLEYDDAVYAGHSFWRFVSKTYGEQIIPSIIYLSKIYKNADEGLMYVLGMSLRDLEKEWLDYYKNYFSGIEVDQPTEWPEKTLFTAKNRRIIQNVKISPDQRYVAFVTYNNGKRVIWLHDTSSDKLKRVFSTEPKYHQNADNSYPVINWHPGSDVLTFINEEKGALKIYFYRMSTGEKEERNLLYFDKVLSFDYAPSGNRIVMSAVKDGVTDIYVHTIASGTNKQVTRDVADDLNPRYLGSSSGSIIFSSNRLTDTIPQIFDSFEKISPVYDLFTYDLERDDRVMTRLSEGLYTNRTEGISSIPREFLYLGNQNGTINKFKASFDSTISFIDTVTHFRYFIDSKPVTNYNRSILAHDATKGGRVAEVVFENNRYRLLSGPANRNDSDVGQLKTSPFRDEQILSLHQADSIETLRKWLIEQNRIRRDTMTKPFYEYFDTGEPIDINHYIFEKEKQNYLEQQWRKDYMDIDLDTARLDFPQMRIYQPTFYNNFLAFQVDFSFLSNSYQVYSGGAPYYNPGFNLLTKIGAIDVFENYKITGGFRLSANFDSNEYLFSVENLKKNIDKQIIYHRQVINTYNAVAYFKVTTQNIFLVFKKPFTPVLSLKGTLLYRNDRYVPQSTDYLTLNAHWETRNWAGLKGELIYDNTIKRSSNTYFGTRFKIFGEYYRDVELKKSDMFVIGIDFRHYQKLHRDLIWANRFAYSSSFGPTKLLYYLGGVDNWMGYIFNNGPMFDNSIPVNPDINYGFQATATNMRGFIQNVRNGNSFFVINSELRFPVVRYIAGHPVRSKFLDNFQIIGFGDLGSAWTGLTPWSGDNIWENQVIREGPVTITLDLLRDPIVGGFGFGLRSLIAGYFIRADWAWGVENSNILPNVFYLSLSLDF